MAEPLPHALFTACGLPQAWRQQQAWRILETRFGTGLGFLAAWRAWLDDPQRPRMLHYVSLCPQAPSLHALLNSVAAFPELTGLADELSPQWTGLLPGFHRLTLQQGQVLLTLCVGDAKAMLHEQQFAADAVFLDTQPEPAQAPWGRWHVKALARCCRRGTRIAATQVSAELGSSLAQGGFALAASAATSASSPAVESPAMQGEFNPHWVLKTSRRPQPAQVGTPGHCAVIGAGLAGASVAAALARRGWQVTVLDAAPTAAAAASGLPAGLMLPHVSGDDSPRSRLSRRGMRLMLQQTSRLLQQGQDWAPSGVLEHRLDKSPGLPAVWPPEGQVWSRPGVDKLAPPWSLGMRSDASTLWHAQGAWIKPERMVQAWLAQQGVRFQGCSAVARLQRAGHGWQLLDAAGTELANASHVVLANGAGLMDLMAGLRQHTPHDGLHLAPLPALQAMRGQVSWALQREGDATTLPPFPVNGLGSLIPQVPLNEGLAWFAGATYEDEAGHAGPLDTAAHHRENLQRLQTLLPTAGHALAGLFEPPLADTSLQAWSQTRCVASDRLPLLGPLEAGEADGAAEVPTLWVSSAMGSRGLSLAMLCAELLAAQWHAEPWPVEASLAAHLRAGRGAG